MGSSTRSVPGYRRTDPDETSGRLLYRQLADSEGRRSIGLARKVTLVSPHPLDRAGGEKGAEESQ